MIVDTETMEFEVVSNTGVGAANGAGIQAAQLVSSKGVMVVLTGNVGPNAYGALTASSVEVVTGVAGSVEDAVNRFKRGELQSTKKPTVGGHFGTGRGGGGRSRRF